MAVVETEARTATHDFEEGLVKKELHEGGGQLPFVCGFCHKQFDRISPYCLHLKEHNEAVDDAFHICDYFESQRHFTYACKKCQLEFPTICVLHSHLLACSGSYVFDHEQNIAFPIEDLYVNNGRSENSDELQVGEVRTLSSMTSEKNTDLVENTSEKMAVDVDANSGTNCSKVDGKSEEVCTQTDGQYTKIEIPVIPVPTKRKRGRPRKTDANKKETKRQKRKPRVPKPLSKIKKTSIKEKFVEDESDAPVSNGKSPRIKEDDDTEEVDDSELYDPAMDAMNSEDEDYTPPEEKKVGAQKRKRRNVVRLKKEATGIKTKPKYDRHCEICGKTFSHNTSLKIHMYGHSDKKNFACEYCPAAFKYPANLTSHLRTHPVPPQGNRKAGSKCDVCGKVCQDSSKLRMHMFSHSEARNLVCEICSTSYKYPNHLQVHMKTHKESKPFYCDLCGEGFIVSDSLRKHKIRKHTKDRDHRCAECGATFKFASCLKRHLQSHATDKKHQCEVCGQQFSRKNYLLQHMRIHTNQRRFACTEEGCQRRFFTNYQLQCHLKMHSGERPFKCPMCPAEFIQRKELRRHLKKMHGQNLEDLVTENEDFILSAGASAAFSAPSAISNMDFVMSNSAIMTQMTQAVNVKPGPSLPALPALQRFDANDLGPQDFSLNRGEPNKVV